MKHLSRKDFYMLRRMAAELADHTLSFPWRPLRDRHGAFGDAVHVLGLLKGSVDWLFQKSAR
jgi:hypothetical protein